MLAKSQRQLAKDGNARLGRIIAMDPPRSSGSHASIDPAICQRNDHLRPDLSRLPVTRPDSHAAMHIKEASALRAAFIPRETDFMPTDYAHLCKTSCARQCKPRAMVPGPSQSITPLGTNTRLEPYNATKHVNERTFTTPHWTASDLTNDGTTDYKSPHIDGYPLSASTHDQFSVAAEATATLICSDQGIKSAIAEQSGADNSSAHTPTECHASAADMTSYKALSLAPSGEVYNANIIKVSARKLAKPNPLYKAHFLTDNQAQWVPASRIPPAVLAIFFVQRYVINKYRFIVTHKIANYKKVKV
jgi:hypothetical protein